MHAFHNSNESGGAPVRASNNSNGQHAVEAWENEGGPSAARGHEVPHPLASRTSSVTHGPTWDAPKGASDDEDQSLRSLGAAVIMRWSTIPAKLQKELFEEANAIGELLQADGLKEQVARFLHKQR